MNNKKMIDGYDENDVLIYDLECETKGDSPDGNKDKMKIFGFYSYKNGKKGLIPYTSKDAIRKVIKAHKYMVGFNNIDYDNPILEREGFDIKYKIHIDLLKVFKKRASSMITKKGMLGNVLMRYSLDYITRFLGLVDDDSAKGDIDYNIFKKNKWTKEEVEQIKHYTLRDIEITRKLYEWCNEYFEGFKDFVNKQDIQKKNYLTDTMAKFGYKADCHAMGWEPMYNTNIKETPKRPGGGYVSYPAVEEFKATELEDGSYKNLIIQLDFSSLYPMIMIMANLHSRNKDNTGWHGGTLFKVKGYYNDKEMSGLGRLIRKWYFVRLRYKLKGILTDGTIFKYKDAHKYLGKNHYIIPLDDGEFDYQTIKIDQQEVERLENLEYDNKEYTIKILINLQYGILYHPYYQLVFDDIAGDDCTGLGRQFVKYARKVFRDAGYPIIYTDSVSKDSNIRLKNGKEISIEDYWNKHTLNRFDDDKEYAECTESVLTCDDNYKNKLVVPKRIIRHKTKRKMYNIILSNCHSLKVTEDHSLITINPKTQKLVSVKPEQLKDIKYVLVNNKNIRKMNSKNYSKELYFLMGHVLGNGNLIKQKNSKKYNYIRLSDYYIGDVINKILKPLQKEYDFNISYTNKKTDIVINSTYLAELFSKLGFSGTASTKSIPQWLSNEIDINIEMFLKGYMSADGGILYRGNAAIVRASSVNTKLLSGIDNLFKILGYRTSIYKENKKTKYNNIISKYNMIYLNIKDKQKYLKNIGFIYDIKETFETENFVWFGDNSFAKKPSSYIKKHNRILSDNLNVGIDSDFSLVNIKSIETYYDEDYVYDFSIDKYERFYANDILVHNTDSWYFIDVFNDKEKYLKLKDKVINDIKNSMPFPQITFDADIDAEIKYMFFFKGNNSDEKDEIDMDEDDIVNKPKGLMKKNYIYVETDDKLIIKNLGIKKKNISALSKKIFWEHLVPKIKSEARAKFSPVEIENLMVKLLKEDLSLAMMRKSVKPLTSYKKSTTGIQAQISKRYGAGIHFMIPNIRGVGVGKDTKYCTDKEFDEYDMTISDIDFKVFRKELSYFIKKPKITTLFDFTESSDEKNEDDIYDYEIEGGDDPRDDDTNINININLYNGEK